MPRPIKKKASKKDRSEVEITGVLEDLRDTLKKKQKTVLIYSLIAIERYFGACCNYFLPAHGGPEIPRARNQSL